MANKYVYVESDEIEILVTKHQAGKHDQKTHGRGGGGSFDSLSAYYSFMDDPKNKQMTYEEMEALSVSQKPEYGHSAVFEYVNNSNQINTALRADPEFAEEQFGSSITELEETMLRAPNITQPITVYRGIRGGDDLPEVFESLEAGDVFSDSAFLSTSLSPKAALGFAGVYNNEETQGIVFEIQVPANSEGIFPNSWLGLGGMGPSSNNFASELEFLLPRDSQLKVISTEGKVWKLEVANG